MTTDTMERTRDYTTRDIQVRAATIDRAGRTVDAVLSTPERVRVADWQLGEMIDEVLIARGARYGQNVPLLDSHSRYSVDDVLGSVRNIRVDGEVLVGTLHLASGDARADAAWSKIEQGHISDVSVGYRVETGDYTDVAPNSTAKVDGREWTAGERRLRITRQWRLRELSLVPIGADERAKLREGAAFTNRNPKGSTMDEPNSTATTAQRSAEEPTKKAAPPNGPALAPEQVLTTERERAKGIRALAGPDTPADLIDKCIYEGCTVSEAAQRIIEHERGKLREAVTHAPGAIVRDRDRDCSGEVLTASLIMRGIDNARRRHYKTGETHEERMIAKIPVPRGLVGEERKRKQYELAERGDQFRGLSLLDICRESIRLCGGREVSGASETVREAIRLCRVADLGVQDRHRAFSTTTLTNIFSQTIGAQLLEGYESYPDTTRSGWVQEGEVPNFLQTERALLGKTGTLSKLPSGGTAEHATIGDSLEYIKAARYAKQFVVDEQDLINDNLRGLTRVPFELGDSAAQLRPDLVYALVLANAALNADSVALFHSTHSNLGTGAGSALSSTSLPSGVIAMAKQTQGGRNLNLRAGFLLCPQDLWYTSMQLLNSTSVSTSEALTTGGVQFGTFNPISGANLTPIFDNRMGVAGVTDPVTGTAYAGTATNWFLAESRGRNTIEVAYVRGTNRSPVVRTKVLDSGTWGIGWDVHHDIGAAVLDYRGLYKADGA